MNTSGFWKSVEISIHTLTQRVTVPLVAMQKGRKDFNPHPHAEGDSMRRQLNEGKTDISIHTLTQRVTCKRRFAGTVNDDFNPHPHAEGDCRTAEF